MSDDRLAEVETRLVRGFPDRIHLRGCAYAGRVVPWIWAEGRSDSEWTNKAWLKPCGHCLPDLYRLRKQQLAALARLDSGNILGSKNCCPEPDQGGEAGGWGVQSSGGGVPPDGGGAK